jgi:hypothetical protein
MFMADVGGIKLQLVAALQLRQLSLETHRDA